jgi:siderophore synthetase component
VPRQIAPGTPGTGAERARTADRPHPTEDRPHRTADRPHPTEDRPHRTADRPHPTGAGEHRDPLEHHDPDAVAQAAAVENLLRCWTRENNLAAPDHGTLRIPLGAAGTALLVPVHYWSATGWHRFGRPVLESEPQGTRCADAETLAALLAQEAAHDPCRATDRSPAEDGGELIARVADSVRRTAVFVADRRRHAEDAPEPFLAAEQSLLLGHPLHPAPKSREGLSGREARRYSPELRGSFQLHWMAVDRRVLAQDSAWTERGRVVPADVLTHRFAGGGLPLPNGFAALPMHPWQIRDAIQRPQVAALLDAGLLVQLGPHGAPWHPTSSVRTLYQPGALAMLKLSLGLRITNSRRENLRKELHRGVEVHRLLRSGLDAQWQAEHPGFGIVRDPAWLAVDGPDGAPLTGLDVMIRHNPFGPGDDASCIAALVSPRPVPVRSATSEVSDISPVFEGQVAERQLSGACQDGMGETALRSRLACLVAGLAGRTGRSRGAVATEWFLRYLEKVVRPVLWLDSAAGIALEAHQQNTLVLLDPDGWPVGGRYRDNQGYYFRASRRTELERRLPGIGGRSDTFVPDEVTDERFAYYLGINNVFGLIGAFGSQRLADEAVLLAAFRRFLGGVASGPQKLRTPLPQQLLDSPVLRCKANLLTRLHGLDELVGPVDTQSVYVTMSNPLHS